jgi:histidinol dehydrogenase
MVAQAEHDPEAVVILILVGDVNESAVLEELTRQSGSSPRSGIVRSSLESSGAVLRAENVAEAIQLSNEFAPEHLQLAVSRPDEILPQLRNAGAVFLGSSSSVAFGDYMTGANHVLPTGGLARSYSGLSTLDFVRWTSYQSVTPEAAQRLSADVQAFANAEFLSGHAAAAAVWSAS